MIYRFMNVEIDTDTYRLSTNAQTVSIEPRVLELVVYLIEQRHRMVPKAELVTRIWKAQVIGPTSLPLAICLARKAVGHPSAIRTVHSRGYQWATSVDVQQSGGGVGHAPEEAAAQMHTVGREANK